MSLLLYITHHLLNFLHKSSFPRIVAACITLCCTFHRRPQRTCLVILSPARTASYMGTSHSFSVWAHFGGWSWRQWVQVADEHVSCEGDSGGSLQDALSAAETESNKTSIIYWSCFCWKVGGKWRRFIRNARIDNGAWIKGELRYF